MKMRELLSDGSKWCQGSMARDKDGKMRPADHSKAVQWCLLGAFGKCYGEGDLGSAYVEYIKLLSHFGLEFPFGFDRFDLDTAQMRLVDWNNAPERQFGEVKELLERLDI